MQINRVSFLNTLSLLCPPAQQLPAEHPVTYTTSTLSTYYYLYWIQNFATILFLLMWLTKTFFKIHVVQVWGSCDPLSYRKTNGSGGTLASKPWCS